MIKIIFEIKNSKVYAASIFFYKPRKNSFP